MARCSACVRSKSRWNSATTSDVGSHAETSNCISAWNPISAGKESSSSLCRVNLGELRRKLAASGTKFIEDDALPGVPRFYAEDPWGNRLEFLEAAR